MRIKQEVIICRRARDITSDEFQQFLESKGVVHLTGAPFHLMLATWFSQQTIVAQTCHGFDPRSLLSLVHVITKSKWKMVWFGGDTSINSSLLEADGLIFGGEMSCRALLRHRNI